jgi:hypothetical protein
LTPLFSGHIQKTRLLSTLIHDLTNESSAPGFTAVVDHQELGRPVLSTETKVDVPCLRVEAEPDRPAAEH